MAGSKNEAAAGTDRGASTPHPREGDVAGLLDIAGDALVLLDRDGTVAWWSGGARRLYGYTHDEASGRTFAQLFGPGAALGEDVLHQLRAYGEWAGELFGVASDGSIVQLYCRCAPRLDPQGEVAAIYCSLADITEQRRAEKEIVLLRNVMEQRIQRRTSELEASNEDLREFAYSLAHDLRAPLASIDGFSAQLEARLAASLDDKSAHYLRRVRAGVRMMGDLTDGLLALAGIANAEMLHQGVDLSSVARSILERMRELHPDRAMTVAVHDTPPVKGDVRLLTDVLQNLLGNAWKFTSRTAAAHIEFGSAPGDDGSAQFYVRDNGAGFDPAYAYKLFAPFQRLHASHEFEGTGVGLAMVRKIVSRHGGRVWAESNPGEGATFYFTLR